jgi:hypothetical protein
MSTSYESKQIDPIKNLLERISTLENDQRTPDLLLQIDQILRKDNKLAEAEGKSLTVLESDDSLHKKCKVLSLFFDDIEDLRSIEALLSDEDLRPSDKDTQLPAKEEAVLDLLAQRDQIIEKLFENINEVEKYLEEIGQDISDYPTLPFLRLSQNAKDAIAPSAAFAGTGICIALIASGPVGWAIFGVSAVILLLSIAIKAFLACKSQKTSDQALAP